MSKLLPICAVFLILIFPFKINAKPTPTFVNNEWVVFSEKDTFSGDSTCFIVSRNSPDNLYLVVLDDVVLLQSKNNFEYYEEYNSLMKLSVRYVDKKIGFKVDDNNFFRAILYISDKDVYKAIINTFGQSDKWSSDSIRTSLPLVNNITLIDQMIKGNVLRIRVKTIGQQDYAIHEYSLKGFTVAYKEYKKQCFYNTK